MSQTEFSRVRAAFGRRAAAAARLFLCGHPVPRPTAPASPDKLEILHALYALFVAAEQTRARIRSYSDPDVQALLEDEKKTFNHLAHVCCSNFSL